MQNKQGFTLIELLVVIGIVAILSATVILVINPAQLLRQARDSNRLSDYGTLNQAFNLLGLYTEQVFGVASTTYISIPDPTATSTAGTDCSGVVGLPSLPPSWIYHCAASSTYRNVNGTGWMPVNFGLFSSGAPFSVLPVDPINKGGNFYAYVAGNNRYVFTILLESEKYLQKGKLALRDQGTDPTRLESGTDLLLWARASGLNGYWPFDAGSGTTANDSSGNGNTGTLLPLGSEPTWTTGKVGGAIQFDGLNDRVSIPISPSLTIINAITFSGWVKATKILTTSVWENWLSYDHGFQYNISTDEHTFTIQDAIGGSATISRNRAFQPNNWHHIVGTADSTSMYLYIDGVEIGSTPRSGNIKSPALPILIGNGGGLTQPWNGVIDEVRIHNRALSAPEVQALYNATQ